MSNGVRMYSAGPLSVIALILLIGLVILMIPLLFLGLVGVAFTRLGFSWIAALAVVLLMLFGSFVNIPLYRIRRDMIRVDNAALPFADAANPFAHQSAWETVVSLNLGGALIPVAVSVYLLYRATSVLGMAILQPVAIGIVIVAVVAWLATRSIPGYGLRAPLFIPGLVAILCGLLLAGGAGLSAGVTAFVAGTAGTLIGAGIAQIPRIRDMEIPEVSIGGSGMFGAIFLACILSALIA
ncbi:MAG: DUF1614 domain-containing protein [Methanoregula sp.]|jgi:uncharacterized membrane protein|uniref:DUF1614 domain-containing protein n=1 Tax=Methanoregula sp. TaxID=2052170 RepID=UPI0025EA5F72|nr:DUF1614 domain-containing protein [Methanoregula sp.]MCK9632179.1 DUF1614 domain-containing protein [Methanoregula sp.]